MANNETCVPGKLIARHEIQVDDLKVEGLTMVMMLPFGGNKIKHFGLDCDPHYQMIVSQTLIWSCLLTIFH
jgi:hypothetical protein